MGLRISSVRYHGRGKTGANATDGGLGGGKGDRRRRRNWNGPVPPSALSEHTGGGLHCKLAGAVWWGRDCDLGERTWGGDDHGGRDGAGGRGRGLPFHPTGCARAHSHCAASHTTHARPSSTTSCSTKHESFACQVRQLRAQLRAQGGFSNQVAFPPNSCPVLRFVLSFLYY
jgi:hypothetical protein